jgi:enoyl-CoA hydratase
MTDGASIVLVEMEDRVATVTLNRPEARNALSRALNRALWDAMAAVGADPEVDVVILTGADPAFCAGVDLKELSAGSVSSAANTEPSDGTGPGRDSKNGLFRFFPLIDKPVIGAVNGVAATGGFEVALQCTFLVASERARFADTHARVGILPGGGLTVLLSQAVGLRRAIELSLTGNFLDAHEALSLGLVNHVVPHDDLLPVCRRLAADIVSNDQAAVRRLLDHYRALPNAPTQDEAHRVEATMAQTWQPAGDLSARREAVMARGRSQGGTRSTR